LNVINIENRTVKLKEILSSSASPREKVLLAAEYFHFLLLAGDKNIVESYLTEFIDPFLTSLYNFSPVGTNPSITEELLNLSRKLTELDFLKPFQQKILSAVENINTELESLQASLSGEKDQSIITSKFYMPVIEETTKNGSLKLGLLESISVSLKKTKDSGKFIIVPSGKELEKRLINQVKTSWKVALNNSSNYIKKKNDNLDVVVSFDKRFGYYTGDSLGTALAILFLEEILRFYNSPIIIDKRNITAITGGIDEDGNLISVSNEIIKQKTEVVFYSDVNLFVLPNQDEAVAKNELGRLHSIYPKRRLKIESVETFEDLLNRRNIVEIRKQKVIVRSAKFASKNWAAVSLLTIVIFLMYVGRFYDFDNNPAILVNKGYWLSVQNKNGKELWKKRMWFDQTKVGGSSLSLVAEKIVDINNDGTNEIIIARDDPRQYSPPKQPGRVAVYSSDGKQIWEYYFRDTIESVEMVHSSRYQSCIIDTFTVNGSKAIA